MFKSIIPIFLILLCLNTCKETPKNEPMENPDVTFYYTEAYRPQFHFSPEEKWMNDPNGLVYHKGIYHLFYQYYPDDIVWGPMHWGHATSKDMIHWEHKTVALFPDENGYIFSGSAVVGKNNTSGFGTVENPPLVAIFTYHDMEGEKAGRTDYQTQGIAYSLDNGDSWTKFDGNPVIKNEGMRDFRDPKVFWNEIKNNWTMLLVAGDHLQIWQSDNLKDWNKVSEFGKDKGAHGGVWECPDMFKLNIEGTATEKWVLLISINPGAPNGGSGTQYFVGDFDGTTFTTDQEDAKWVDWGRDNYAGVTYNNVPDNERIFIGWMSNWQYARDTPTEVWRSANTIPRNLSLHENNGTLELYSYPISNFDEIVEQANPKRPVLLAPAQKSQLPLKYGNQSEIRFHLEALGSKWIFSNSQGDSLVISLDSSEKVLSLDRSKSGKVDFNPEFVLGQQHMPVPNLPTDAIEVRMLLDKSSLEIFLNKGQYVMTNQIFPNADYTQLTLENTSDTEQKIDRLSESKVMRIWD
ncbi:glycoside hydrolase family 32 protein [Maribacter aurantiacus]|uniref:Glycoside hydrolase family 32 protein n=2 Tax=Maribacter aurantiacus TaxID=1882343 RepID=A0A5R8MDU6_9FLAO|nr:glycoside hydrolase family 32 protein [Maribacter aurantiacus]